MVVSAPRLAVEELSYGYPGHVVGRHVSFTVGAGEVLCVLGRNGEGKSTLFKTVLGLLSPHSGAVRVDGEPVSGWSPRRRALTFGYVPQNGRGTFPFTVAELVLMGRTAHRGAFAAPSAGDRATADEAIATLGIGHLADREWQRVSGGERQLALIARALAQQPRILVLDEPNGEPRFRQPGAGTRCRSRPCRDPRAERAAVDSPPGAGFRLRRPGCSAGRRGIAADRHPAEVITAETLRACYSVEVAVLPVADNRYRVCVPRSYLS